MILPDAALIEIIERTNTPGASPGVIVPNEVRINGIPLLTSADDPIVIHEMQIPAQDVVRVTLTLFARRVVISDEPTERPTQP